MNRELDVPSKSFRPSCCGTWLSG